MEKWYSRFRRGDVWFIHLSSEFGDGRSNSSVQKKSRPYLIVSCEENNMNAVTLNAVPICTRDNDHLPMHVFYVYQDGTANGKNQIILCEQITTLSTYDFDAKGSYFMYSLNLELMNQVDETLTRQLGLKPRVADMKVIERLIDELASKKEEEIKKEKEREISERVEKIVANLASRFGITLNAEVLQNNKEYRDNELAYADKDKVKEMRQTAIDRKSAIPAKEDHRIIPPPLRSMTPSTKSKRSSNRWTPESKKQFVDDYKTMSLSQIADKYNIKKSSIQSMVCTFKKDLSNVS